MCTCNVKCYLIHLKFRDPTTGQRHVLSKWPKFKNTTEKFAKFKVTEHLEIGEYFRDKNCALWRDIENEALEYVSEKKSSISQIPIGNETFGVKESFYYNVF